MPDWHSAAESLNILHVGKYFAPFRGGVENYMRDLMVALGRRGHSSAAIVHRHDWSLKTRDEIIALDGQECRVVRVGTLAKFLYTPISPAFPSRLRQLIRETNPDVLHLHMPNPSVFWSLTLPSARRLAWVVHWHADVITAAQGWLMRLMYLLYRPFEQAVLRRADAIVATSERYRDSSEPLQPWLTKCRVVPLGLDTARLAISNAASAETAPVSERATDDSSSCLRVLVVGRLTYYKGIRYLIEAASMVHRIRVDVVGEGEQLDELRALVHSLGLENRVAFHVAVDDRALAQMMARCDCLCLPSTERTEAFGIVLLEAMHFGKATVVSDVPGAGMNWIVDHGVTGLTVRPANAEALAAALRTLASDPQLCREMGKRGKEKFDRQFEIHHAVEGIIETYRSVLNPDARTAARDANQ